MPQIVEHTSPNGRYLFVEVPEENWAFHINSYNEIESYPKDGGGGIKPVANRIDLPPGQYEFVGIVGELGEEEIEKIVGQNQEEPPYQPYYRPYGMSEEEYIHEVRIAENKLQQWEEDHSYNNRFLFLLTSLGLTDRVAVVKCLK